MFIDTQPSTKKRYVENWLIPIRQSIEEGGVYIFDYAFDATESPTARNLDTLFVLMSTPPP